MVMVEAGTANGTASSTEATVLKWMIQRLLAEGRLLADAAGNVGTTTVGAVVRFTTWLHFGSCSIIHC